MLKSWVRSPYSACGEGVVWSLHQSVTFNQLRALASSCNPATWELPMLEIYDLGANSHLFQPILKQIPTSPKNCLDSNRVPPCSDLNTLLSWQKWREPLRRDLECLKYGKGLGPPIRACNQGPILRLRVSAQFSDWTFTCLSGLRWKGNSSLCQGRGFDPRPRHVEKALSGASTGVWHSTSWELWQALVTQLPGSYLCWKYMISFNLLFNLEDMLSLGWKSDPTVRNVVNAKRPWISELIWRFFIKTRSKLHRLEES